MHNPPLFANNAVCLSDRVNSVSDHLSDHASDLPKRLFSLFLPLTHVNLSKSHRNNRYSLYIESRGVRSSGVASVTLNGQAFTDFNVSTITLTYVILIRLTRQR